MLGAFERSWVALAAITSLAACGSNGHPTPDGSALVAVDASESIDGSDATPTDASGPTDDADVTGDASYVDADAPSDAGEADAGPDSGTVEDPACARLRTERVAVSPPDSMGSSVATCTAGSMATAAEEATLRRINYYRTLVGLEPVVLDPDVLDVTNTQALALSAAASQSVSAALLSTASATCSTPGSRTAALSSICGMGTTAASVVDLILSTTSTFEPRGALLHPTLASTAFGSVGNYAAIRIFDRNASIPLPDFVAYPPAGVVPSGLPGTQTFTIAMATGLSAATNVSVSVDGGSSVVVSSTYVANTLSWPLVAFSPPGGAASIEGGHSIHVVVDLATLADVTYDVTFVDCP